MDSIKRITEKVRQAVAANPKVQIKMSPHVAKRVQAELARQRALRAAKNAPPPAKLKPTTPEEIRKARNARKRDRQRAPERLAAINKLPVAAPRAQPPRHASLRPGDQYPGAPSGVVVNERLADVPARADEEYSGEEDAARYVAEQGAPVVGGSRPDALERLTGSTAPR